MGGKSSKVEVNNYQMSLHLGLCMGPVDAITAAYYGEKLYWRGYNSRNDVTFISQPALFGGNKKEGGIQGNMTFLMGGSDQVIPNWFAQKLGRLNGNTSPGFRGITSVIHTGPAPGGMDGWFWAANSPYLKSMWYEVFNIPKALGVQNSLVNPKEIDMSVTSSGYALQMRTEEIDRFGDVYKDLFTGSRSASQLARDADRLNAPMAPHYVEEIPKNKEIVVLAGSVGDATGHVYAVPGGDRTPYILRTQFEDYVGVVTEAFPIGVGVETLGGVAYRPAKLRIEPKGGYRTGDANPAHIIFEVLTNPMIGMGLDPADSVNTESFLSSAATLFAESLGLSVAWSTTTSAEDFINDIRDHINAVIFTDPETGKITLKLIRDDYDKTSLRKITPDIAKMTSFARKAWGDTINEIVVSWTNPKSEQEETVTLQDNGNIAEQGEVVSDTKNYYGVRSANLAWTLAARDLRVASAPLCLMEVELDRSFWNLKPGDCVEVSWPEYGIVGLVMRVWEVKYGKRNSSRITASLTEDIFSLPVSAFVQPPTTEWVDSSRAPQPPNAPRLITLPPYVVARVSGSGLGQFEYPVAYAGVLADDPNGGSWSFDLVSEAYDVTGALMWEQRGTFPTCGYGKLRDTLAYESNSDVQGIASLHGVKPAQSVFMLIGTGQDSESELALILSESDGVFSVKRGLFDTVPKNWPAGTPVWYFTQDFSFADSVQQSDGSHPTYKILMNTSQGQLPEATTMTLTGTLNDRLHAPYRPANVMVDRSNADSLVVQVGSTIEVTWATRNRVTEESVIFAWDDPSTQPEPGQTTSLLFYGENQQLIHSISGLEGTSTTVNLAFATGDIVTMEVVSKRGDLTSLQGRKVQIVIERPESVDFKFGNSVEPLPGSGVNFKFQ